MAGEKIYRDLKQEGILVRHFQNPGIHDFVRTTIGRTEDMEKLLVTTARLFSL